MTIIHRILKPLTFFGMAAMLFSCSNNPAPVSEEAKTADSASAAKTPADPASASFQVMLIKHTVADYGKWRTAYDGHDSVRKEYSLTDLDVLRNIDNPNEVLIVEKISDVQKAKDFTALPGLKEAMQKGGVTSVPEFTYMNVLRSDEAKIDSKDRVMISHKVKDFDAWLKVYDGEGKDTRAAQGMIDRVIARDINDPNMVYIVFAVTDMAKAKAAITSDDKKKLMMSAGVEGPPVIEYYRQTN